MQSKDTVTGWTVGLLGLQIICQGFSVFIAVIASDDVYSDSIQTLDGLVLTPLSNLVMLLLVGFGIFRTVRLSLILTLIALLPWIDASVAHGLKMDWDPDIQDDITSVDQALLCLNITRYACYALIATLSALAVRRALQKTRRHAAAA